MAVALASGSYSLVVDPAQGGAILSANWRSPEGRDVAILEPMTEQLPPFKAGCFAMIPFANRIADGRFRFAETDHAIPVDDPVENVAIHGFSRNAAWQVIGDDGATLVLDQRFASDDNPWRYHARQEIGLSEAGIRIALSVRNEGEHAMPFGIGLHPWFHKAPETTLSFASQGALGRDARGLPVAPPRPEPALASEKPTPLGTLPWFDSFFAGWQPRRARIVRREDSIRIDLSAEGALRHLQVFVPDSRPVVCAEPVSHAPDAVNRPGLGPDCAMDVLEPSAELSGAATICVTPLSVRSSQP